MCEDRSGESSRGVVDELLAGVVQGEQRALARTISHIEDRRDGYTDLVSALYAHAGSASVVGVTGSPGSGKSTLVDALVAHLRERGETVGVLAIDPSSPFSGGAVLGDRIRLSSAVGDEGVFVRSMSARGSLGGLSAAADEAVTAMDAFGFDRIVVETVGTGQSEIDVVRTADTIALLVPPDAGDAVQTLKAGVLEIADVFVVNKADRPGVDRTVSDLTAMLDIADGSSVAAVQGSGDPSPADSGLDRDDVQDGAGWEQPIVETVATDGTGVEDLLDVLDDHRRFLETSGGGDVRRRRRHAATIRRLATQSIQDVVDDHLDRAGGVDALAERVRRGGDDPYALVDRLFEPLEMALEDCVPDEPDLAE